MYVAAPLRGGGALELPIRRVRARMDGCDRVPAAGHTPPHPTPCAFGHVTCQLRAPWEARDGRGLATHPPVRGCPSPVMAWVWLMVPPRVPGRPLRHAAPVRAPASACVGGMAMGRHPGRGPGHGLPVRAPSRRQGPYRAGSGTRKEQGPSMI
jgi:hypothetical protein